ncbi:MAG: ATP-binding protein [Flavobacteriales bacterium]|nr:ATP-binding protein [Flavobacteriales bacterium]
MYTELKNILVGLLEESSQFNSNDVLVNVHEDNKKLFFSNDQLTIALDKFPKGIIRESKKTLKESGVNSLCIAKEFVSLVRGNVSILSPVVLYPLSYKVDKVKGTITFSYDIKTGFINPFVESHLKNELDIKLDLKNVDLNLLFAKIESLELDVEIKSPSVIGNFHHHRFQIVKEIEDLIQLKKFGKNITSLFGFEKEEGISFNLPRDILLSADSDHENVFEKTKSLNTVIQGPPGTGKSQVLTNLLAKIVSRNHTSIVVSEKHVALEVLVKKLSQFKLDKFCFIASSDNLSHSFLQELKTTWDYLEKFEFKEVNNLRLSEQHSDNLQMTLDLLAQKRLIGGVTFHKFLELSKDIQMDHFSYTSEVPFIDEYITTQATIKKVYKLGLFNSLGNLKLDTLTSDKFEEFDVVLSGWIDQLKNLSEKLDFAKWSDFNSLRKEAIVCQVLENDLYQKHAGIFKKNSTIQKRFLRLRKKYNTSKKELLEIQKNQSQWKIRPSESETISLLKRLQNEIGIGSFLSRIKTKKRWSDLSNLPFNEANEELQNHLNDIEKINTYSQITIKFCELGIENVETEVDLIYQTIHAYSEIEWQLIADFSMEKKSLLTNSHTNLTNLYSDLKTSFNFSESDEIIVILENLKHDLAKIIPLKSELLKLNKNTLKLFSRNNSIGSFEGELFLSHWTSFKNQFPAFSAFKPADIKEKVNTIIQLQNEEAVLFAKSIENSLFKTFQHYNDLLLTPARKLSEELKEKKARLRKGKSILIKEFSKTRSHPSLRELFHSEAREWIQLLKPIWLSNPTQLAKCFPMESDLFNFAIFDEASQIPLQNALGAILRSQRIIVAGDEFQMGPSSYFKSSNAETIDLLHQANYNWNKIDLKHHYRSVHPDLISFSNKHFYKGKLRTYPSYDSACPIQHYYSPTGMFIDRKNIVEAKSIAERLEKVLQKKSNIGVVAFSEEQKNCIWEHLSSNAQQVFTENLDSNIGFFKAVENVQGDECDQLFISFAYSLNEQGEFHHRFGPMNNVNGRNRLNVLLTRAKEQIHFFCSIKSVDFKLSENESINLLKNWINLSERYLESQELSFPFDLIPDVDDNLLTFSEIQTKLPEAKELVTLQNVLGNRGWNVTYN